MSSQRNQPKTPAGSSRFKPATTPSSSLSVVERERRRRNIEAGLMSSQKDSDSATRHITNTVGRHHSNLQNMPASGFLSQGGENYVGIGSRSITADSGCFSSTKRFRVDNDELDVDSSFPQPSTSDVCIQIALACADIPDDVIQYPVDEEERFWQSPPRDEVGSSSREPILRLADILPNPQTPPRECSSPNYLHLDETPHSMSGRTGILTPPSSGLTSGHGVGPLLNQSDQFPQDSPTTRKGKERDDRRRLLSQWERIQDDPGSPFHQYAATVRQELESEPQSQRSIQSLADPSAVEDAVTADSAATHLAELANLPDHIRKLERKQAAAQKSIDAKSRRIKELEDIVEGKEQIP
ncbi:uncharacterized protein FIBRA_03190 [Fibroporia radiculosa]|uniref:Uncharacterized protein n=1 Tax=Fibroporia radiculosa TaxID=599839 RepID=J4HVU9_9APHY|nr:uncharacterized protein FIBRA_03190 [Fibroporia radiculosa]CCM01142.1 predicted protein [Fibroporia radiculosa]